MHYETRYHAAGVYWVEVPEELAHFITKDAVSDSAPKRKQVKNKPESSEDEFPQQRGSTPESRAETNQNHLRKQVRNHPPMPMPLSDPGLRNWRPQIDGERPRGYQGIRVRTFRDHNHDPSAPSAPFSFAREDQTREQEEDAMGSNADAADAEWFPAHGPGRWCNRFSATYFENAAQMHRAGG